MNKKIVAFGVLMGALVSVAVAPQAQAHVSDGSTAATGDTVVTMTVPKFAEVASIPANVGFTMTSAQYGDNYATNANMIGFKVRTNSEAGLTVQVKGAASPSLANGDIVLSTNDGTTPDLTLGTTAANIWVNDANIEQLPASNNVTLGVRINNLHKYTSTGSSDYTNTLTFTVLPN